MTEIKVILAKNKSKFFKEKKLYIRAKYMIQPFDASSILFLRKLKFIGNVKLDRYVLAIYYQRLE